MSCYIMVLGEAVPYYSKNHCRDNRQDNRTLVCSCTFCECSLNCTYYSFDPPKFFKIRSSNHFITFPTGFMSHHIFPRLSELPLYIYKLYNYHSNLVSSDLFSLIFYTLSMNLMVSLQFSTYSLTAIVLLIQILYIIL